MVEEEEVQVEQVEVLEVFSITLLSLFLSQHFQLLLVLVVRVILLVQEPVVQMLAIIQQLEDQSNCNC